MKIRSTSTEEPIFATLATPANRHQIAAQRLRDLGQRVTGQRVAILALFENDEHLSADEACVQLAASAYRIDRSTVYRVLEHLRDIGLLSETDLGDGIRHYALLGANRHHHLVCLDCKAALAISDDLIAPLRKTIEERHGFETRLDHLAIFGVCPACLRRRSSNSELTTT